MAKEKDIVDIPVDIYNSNDEMVIVAPLGWVDKKSIDISLEKNVLFISWERKLPNFKENLMPMQQDCYWWVFNRAIELPQNIYFDKIHSKLTQENILMVIIPKIIIPEKLKLEVEYM